MRILVYGAGVIGCELTHMLIKNKKNNVTLLARGEWKESIDQKGLVIRHWAQCKTTVDKVRTIAELEPDDIYDMIFVVMQAGQLPAVLPVLSANRSQYIVFVGNNPHARSTLAAMKRPTDKIAFGFQGTAGRREDKRVVSIHAGVGMTIGGATAPLSSAFRQRLAAAFHTTGYRLTLYSDMDEWLKCHIALVMPVCYICYALGGEMKKTTKEQISDWLDASFEGCMMLKAAGVPVNDEQNTEYFRAGTKKRAKLEKTFYAMAKTPIARLCVSDHAMHAVGEMRFLDAGFEEVRAKTSSPMPTWDKLRAAMPAWDELEANTK